MEETTGLSKQQEKVHGNKGKDFQGGKADSAAQWI